ncbi:hypothetical protein [Rhodopirellula bahusiensis]|uniref:hypothetical protein n=1 Tax=Rhodopirellula bahusiensis TaxID=2014065 RepID=UPI001E5D5A42|nr:hypothetical protein [Rhodopirellula bahusiensis]
MNRIYTTFLDRIRVQRSRKAILPTKGIAIDQPAIRETFQKTGLETPQEKHIVGHALKAMLNAEVRAQLEIKWRMRRRVHYSNKPPPKLITGRRTDSRNWVLLNCIVGVNRIAINRGDVIWNGNFDALHDVKIARTFMVRYIVLTASSSGALRNVHH